MHFNKKENFTSNKKILKKLLKETNKENDFFFNPQFLLFSFSILLVLSYLPNTKKFENPNIMKPFTKLNTQIEPSKHQS